MKLALTMAKTPNNFYIKFKTFKALCAGVLELIFLITGTIIVIISIFALAASGLPQSRLFAII